MRGAWRGEGVYNAVVNDARTCVVLRSGERYRGKQGLDYGAGVSADSGGAGALCLHA
jgi:uncharacterized RmlC-like cupin family protein